MRILVDENIPRITVFELRDAGHDVADVRGTKDQGVDDEDIWGKAQREQRTVITTDRGFTRHRDDPHFGLVVVAVRQPNLSRIHKRVMAAIEILDRLDPAGTTLVMRDTIRSLYTTQRAGDEGEADS